MSEELRPPKNVVKTSPRSWREATQTICDAAARLHAANEALNNPPGTKPSKSLRPQRTGAKVIDFGIARFLDGNADADSIVGAGLGSPAYMSPERCRGQTVDGRSDLYALTCRYYELLTGELPFKGGDVATMLYEHCYTPFPDAGSKVPRLPKAVRRVLARGSEKEPSERYQSAAEMASDLTTLLTASAAPGQSGAMKRLDLYADRRAGAAPPSVEKTGSSIVRKIVIALIAAAAVGVVIAVFAVRDLNPSAEPETPVAPAARYVSPFIPASTPGAARVDPAPSSPPTSSPEEKVTTVPQPLDVAAYLRGLGIIDKPMPERGESLRAFDFTRPIPPNEWPTLAPLMDDVAYVLFHNHSGTDEAVSHVARLPMLRRLSLGGEPVTDKGCAFLKGHPVLDRLDLAYTAISGAAMADLASIPNLTALDLRKTTVRGPCWKPLLHSRVSSLWLADNSIEDRDLADLARHPSLSMVQLSNTHVTDAVIDLLASMPNFRQGDFAQTRIDDMGVAKLGRLQNLVTLELSGCPISENGLVPLAKLKKLQRLEIRNLALSDRALDSLAECSKLETVDLSGSCFNASGLRSLSRLSMLRSLRVAGVKMTSAGGSAISRQMLDDLMRRLPNLLVEGTPEETPPR